MLDEAHDQERQARIAELQAQSVPLNEIGRWYAPWALAVLLVVVFLGALWTASAATDNTGYVIGLIGALVALGALIWELELVLSGRTATLGSRFVVEDEVSLLVLIAVLFILALAGLVLAADSASPATNGAGYGLALFCAVFIFLNIKHYFDARETRS
jgi:hypothetical protein